MSSPVCYLEDVPYGVYVTAGRIVITYDAVFDERFSSALAYTPQSYS